MSIDRLTPKHVEHEVFDTPASDITLWRYMDFTRFVALLERRALFCSSIRGFSDRFEGALTSALLADLQCQGDERVRSARAWNLAAYVNCWNEDVHESVALWSMYSSQSGGVAIKSSVGSILASLEADPSGQQHSDELYIGRVRYVDYASADIPTTNSFWPLVHKRTPYRFEHEVRVVVWPLRLIQAATQRSPYAWYEAIEQVAPLGYDLAVDPAVLVEAVVVAPQAPAWLLELVQSVSAQYELGVPVVRSGLDVEPI